MALLTCLSSWRDIWKAELPLYIVSGLVHGHLSGQNSYVVTQLPRETVVEAARSLKAKLESGIASHPPFPIG